jgi:hypothetical protein
MISQFSKKKKVKNRRRKIKVTQQLLTLSLILHREPSQSLPLILKSANGDPTRIELPRLSPTLSPAPET